MRFRAALAAVFALLTVGCTSSSINVTAPSADKCQVSVVNSITTNVPSAGTNGSLEVSTTRDCTWSVSSNAAWAQIATDASGQGSATVRYIVMANPDAILRRATLEVNNTQVSLTQDAAPCRFSVAPSNTAVSASGGTIPVTIDTLNGCAWNATSDAAWLTIVGAASGSATATLTLRAAANSGGERAGTVRVAGQSVVVTEAGATVAEPPGTTPLPAPGPIPSPVPTPTPTPPPPSPAPCVYSLSSSSTRVGAGAGTASVNVTTASGCSWTATANAAWIAVSSAASGSGNGTVTFTTGANPGAERSGTLTIAGQTFTVTQSAAPCTFTVTPPTQAFAAAGGRGSARPAPVPTTCPWAAANGDRSVTPDWRGY